MAGKKKSKRLKDSDVKWVVNSLGELGVQIGNRCFFLYKGESLVYPQRQKNSDGSPMLIRLVGKREFGVVQHPAKWVEHNWRKEPKYTEELVSNSALDDDSDNPEYDWHPLPKK